MKTEPRLVPDETLMDREDAHALARRMIQTIEAAMEGVEFRPLELVAALDALHISLLQHAMIDCPDPALLWEVAGELFAGSVAREHQRAARSPTEIRQ